MKATVPQNTFGRGSPEYESGETPTTLETAEPTEPPEDIALPSEEDPSKPGQPGDYHNSQKPSEDMPAAPVEPSVEPPVEPPAESAADSHQPVKKYGWRPEWDAKARDFVHRKDDGTIVLYAAYQRHNGQATTVSSRKPGGDASARADLALKSATLTLPQPASFKDLPPPSRPPLGPPARSLTGDSELGSFVHVRRPSSSGESDSGSISSRDRSRPPPRTQKVKRLFEQPLDKRFDVVGKPKRFFSVGRIFKTPWFEPGGDDMPGQPSEREWRDECPEFYESKPIAKFRWFVVVRRRQNHTLCFSITTFGGKGAAKTRRGRAVDFVVLYKSEIDPPMPYDEESITRAPLSVIIEEGDQYISPLARLDCGRIYTVEDNVRVMKIGRIHPDSLRHLEQYYKESVLA